MQPLIWDRRPDGLRAPALVCAFKGWNDAGDAASAALTFLGAGLGATRFAQIDPEDFYDFQSTRPKIELVDGRTRELVWPQVEVWEARIPRAPIRETTMTKLSDTQALILSSAAQRPEHIALPLPESLRGGAAA